MTYPCESQLCLDLSLAANLATGRHHRGGYLPEMKVLTLHRYMVGEAKAEVTAESPKKVVELFRRAVCKATWFDDLKECVVVFGLDRKNGVIGFNLVSLGSSFASLIEVAAVFRPLVAAAANSFILSHNHPSGVPAPSRADIEATRNLSRAAEVMNIALVDHVIIGDPRRDPVKRGYYSFREEGAL
jgi:DNA repair protein RadC